jgi:hypothetical protein
MLIRVPLHLEANLVKSRMTIVQTLRLDKLDSPQDLADSLEILVLKPLHIRICPFVQI